MNQNVVLTISAAFFLVVFPCEGWAGGLYKPSSKIPEAQKLIDQAWDLSRTGSSSELFKQCADLMEQADKLDPNNPTILIDISIYYWEYGDSLPKQTPEQKKYLEGIYAKGLAAAKKSIKLKESPPAVYWAAVNKAAGLEFSSIFAQAAAFPELYRQTHYVIDREPDYDYGAPGRLWSEILTRVPKKVVEIVGKKYVAEAMDLINAAIKQEPRFLDNYNYKARFMWIYFEDKDEALKLLDNALKMDTTVFPEEVVSNQVAQRTARQLWKNITGKEYPQK